MIQLMPIRFLILFLLSGFVVYGQQPAVSKWPRGITYEIFVHAFADSNGDGIGDLNGVTAKLDYLKSLGVEGIWLMPVNPSPSYHKYDVVDYYAIHPDYGTMADFKRLIAEAHSRGIKVVMDLVLNHSSSKHPWFLDAQKNEQSPYRDYYVWTHQDDPQTKKPVRITGADSDNSRHWHQVPGSPYLYYGFFSGSMPDLNFDSPKLRAEVFKIGRFWLQEVGVDGFRLDAARHIFPDEREHDSQKWWEYFLSEMKKVKEDVYIVGEVWATAPLVGPYLNGIPALFNFDLGFAITRAVNNSRSDSLLEKLQQTRSFYGQVNPDFVDAIFLTNHDQNRIMSMLNGSLPKAKLAAALLFTLPGSPYIYYGEEIGMMGRKPDEFIREPMLWDRTANDKFRTKWVRPRYSADSSVAPVAVQQKDPGSLFHVYQSWANMRNQSSALTYGDLQLMETGSESLVAFMRTDAAESLVVVHNLAATPALFNVPAAAQGYQKIRLQTGKASLKDGQLQLPPFSSVVLSR